MIAVSNLRLSFGKRVLFQNVNIKFTPENCYGLIGANGSGKSSFLKILSKELEQDEGTITVTPGYRLASLQQDHFAFDELTVSRAVIAGHKRLYQVMQEREELYSKEDFTESDGYRVTELEEEFSNLGGWLSEGEVGSLLSGLGVEEDLYEQQMKNVDETVKVRVLLAQALFGNPDILLLDEPTNHLDVESIRWLEEFLLRFKSTVIVVSHDRHFLDKVCTHIADIDYGQIRLFVGNYSFWNRMSSLIAAQKRDQATTAEEKAKNLRAFIQRFSANAAKSKQATSRKKELEKLELVDLPTTSRRFPYIAFKPQREPGRVVLEIEDLAYESEGEKLFSDFSFSMGPGDKVALVGPFNQAKTALMEILTGREPSLRGKYSWGVTITTDYFPKDNTAYFTESVDMLEWISQYSGDADLTYLRGLLGRMLFSGEEALKKVSVLSGGEKVRCLLAKMMLSDANVLLFDEPTAHLDLEAITSLNTALLDFSGALIFASHDYQFVNTIANRIIEFIPGGVIDRRENFESYLNDSQVKSIRTKAYGHRERVIL